MLKNKLDYKLLNTAIIMVIIFLLYQTGNLWMGILGKIGSIIFPFFLAFILAYALYPVLKYLESKKIPVDIDYDLMHNLASEAKQKLKEVKPLTLGQAIRISGVNPADISILSMYLKRGK